MGFRNYLLLKESRSGLVFSSRIVVQIAGLGTIMSLVFLNISNSMADTIPGSRYTSARAAAMGDAFLPLADDPTSALFYNPAFLSKTRRLLVEPFNLSFYGNSNLLSNADSNFAKAFTQPSYASKAGGNWVGGGGAYAASISTPFFTFGLLVQAKNEAKSNADGSITYQSLYQLVPTIGQGFSFLNGVFRLGYSIQWVNEATGTVTAGTANSYFNGLAQGSAISGNVGFNVTLPLNFKPSLNIVGRNLFNAKYSGSSIVPLAQNPTGPPPTDPMSFDTSLSIQPVIGKSSRFNLVAEMRDMSNQSQMSATDRLSLGGEFDISNRLFIRMGYRGGRPSGGLGLKKFGAETSITYYTEEIGTASMPQGDSRILFQYQLRNF